MQLKDSMYRIESEEEGVWNLLLDAEHFIYRAHFPGKPITPGVCIIKTATELLEGMYGRKLSLVTVRNVKFMSVISPVDSPRITYRLLKAEEQDGKLSVRMEVTGFAKMSLIYE